MDGNYVGNNPNGTDFILSDNYQTNNSKLMASTACVYSAVHDVNNPIATGTTEPRSLADRFGDIINVKDFGAKGDGITDDTEAIQAALDSQIATVFFPEGTYSVSELFLKKQKTLLLGTATLKARRALLRRFSILTLETGAAGTVVSGGIFDGNRDILGPDYANRDWLWTGIWVESADNVTIQNTAFINIVGFGYYANSSDNFTANKLFFSSCGKAFSNKGGDNAKVSNIVLKDISNAGLDVYAHATEIRDCENFTLEHAVCTNFSPDENQREPVPGVFTFERMRNVTISDITVSGFSGKSSSGLHRAIALDTIQNATLTGINVRGFNQGIFIASCLGVVLDGFVIDGDYKGNTLGTTNTSALIIVTNSGLLNAYERSTISVQTALTLGNRNSAFSNSISISSGIIRRGRGNGIELSAAHGAITSCIIEGVDKAGIYIKDTPTNGSSDNFAQKDALNVTIANNDFVNIGNQGINLTYGNADIRDNRFVNCGQLASSLGVPFRSCICHRNTSKQVLIVGNSFRTSPCGIEGNVISWSNNAYRDGVMTACCGFTSLMSVGKVFSIAKAYDDGSSAMVKITDYIPNTGEAKLEILSKKEAFSTTTTLRDVTGDATIDSSGMVIFSENMDFTVIPPLAFIKVVIDGVAYWRQVYENSTGRRLTIKTPLPVGTINSINYIATGYEEEVLNSAAYTVTGSGDSSAKNIATISGNTIAEEMPISVVSGDSLKIERMVETDATLYGKTSLIVSPTSLNNGKLYFGVGALGTGYGVSVTGYGTASGAAFMPDMKWADGVGVSGDNAVNLGGSSNRWAQVYSASDSINTSDANEKQSIEPYPDEVLDAWSEVELRQFLFNDSVEKKGKNARIHAGVIAQQVVEAFSKHNLDATKYGLLCYDEWPDEYEDIEIIDAEAKYDSEGNEISPVIKHTEKKLVTPAGNRYGIRYSEALCLEAAYQRRESKILKEEIELLKERLNKLENT